MNHSYLVWLYQAVLAHPELYFSKLVLLGEGDSEEIIIPQLAKALDFDLDPSFVAFVKLAGRHVNHMWRLLSELNIPFLTLIDLDLGRSKAGQCRIEYAIGELNKIGQTFGFPDNISAKDLKEEWLELDQINDLTSELEKHGVFFSYPLDVDMAMIRAYPDCYCADKAKKSDRETLKHAVLGKEHEVDNYDDNGEELYSDEELKKYRYLFCTKSKVASHYKAMADILELDEDEIETECPDFIKRLIEKCSVMLRGTEDE